MASKRGLKKEINAIATLLVSECLFRKLLCKDNECEAIESLLNKAFELRSEFIQRVNATDGSKNPKIVKKYYQKLNDDFDNAIDEVIDGLAAIGAE